MAKRFTDTDKWKRSWFRKLPPKAKVAWQYICDQCDHAGIWVADFELASFQMGFSLEERSLLEMLGDKLIKIDSDKYFVPSFFEFQYGDSKDGFKAKQSAIKILSKLGLMDDAGALLIEFPKSSEHSPNTSELSMDSPSIGIGKSIGKSNTGGLGEKTSFDFEALYGKYPLKEGKPAGLLQCRKQIKTQADYDALSKAIDRYAAQRAKDGLHHKMFSSFLGSEKTGYPWREWCNPETGTVSTATSDINWSKIFEEKKNAV